MARHVDSTVHMFDEWGLPMMKNEETGRYLREGKWQIMIHGESYKPIVAEAAKKSADKIYNRIMITHLLMMLSPTSVYYSDLLINHMLYLVFHACFVKQIMRFRF